MGANNGGGGGRGGGGEDGTTSLDDLEQKAHDYVDSSEYEIEINNYFQDLLKDFNDRDVDGIKKHLETIIAALETEIDIINLLFGGSIQKHTYINGLSDVDILAILDDASYKNMTPNEVLKKFSDRLKQRLPNTQISTGNLAVTIEFTDGHKYKSCLLLNHKMEYVLRILKVPVGVR